MGTYILLHALNNQSIEVMEMTKQEAEIKVETLRKEMNTDAIMVEAKR